MPVERDENGGQQVCLAFPLADQSMGRCYEGLVVIVCELREIYVEAFCVCVCVLWIESEDLHLLC